jgi:Ala-tRNA(Pro) deacylase
VKYTVSSHSQAYTAQEIAALAHIPGQELAKTVIVRLDDRLAMMVLPARYNVDFTRLSHALNIGDVYLASEDDFKDAFPECEIGAMPPFGNLYDMEVDVSESLSEDEEIFFNAGSHTELIKMRYADFERLVEPKVMSFTTRYPSEIYRYEPDEESGDPVENETS